MADLTRLTTNVKGSRRGKTQRPCSVQFTTCCSTGAPVWKKTIHLLAQEQSIVFTTKYEKLEMTTAKVRRETLVKTLQELHPLPSPPRFKEQKFNVHIFNALLLLIHICISTFCCDIFAPLIFATSNKF